MSPNGMNPSDEDAKAPLVGEAVLQQGDPSGLKIFESAFFDALKTSGYDEGQIFAIRLAMEEAIANGFRHGNDGDPRKTVKITHVINTTDLQVSIEDEGTGFDPEAVPDPTEDANLEIPSGRGLMLMRAYMTEVNVIPPGNRIEMYFRRDA
ncbi:MAG: ATP-binding protein [Planctomycetota bacterium]|jgi:serine/threonine-protein kinase RsbW|nr:ATP-binding protein [Planctomycetota bacterium]